MCELTGLSDFVVIYLRRYFINYQLRYLTFD